MDNFLEFGSDYYYVRLADIPNEFQVDVSLENNRGDVDTFRLPYDDFARFLKNSGVLLALRSMIL